MNSYDNRLYYCPKCGNLMKKYEQDCDACGRFVHQKKTNFSANKYYDLAKDKYGDERLWYKFILDTEIINNKEFKKEYLNDENIQNKIYTKVNKFTDDMIFWKQWLKERKAEADNKPKEIYQPHCPICNSPHITKISTTRKLAGAATFGIFSKTARSQWVCKTCGSKF